MTTREKRSGRYWRNLLRSTLLALLLGLLIAFYGVLPISWAYSIAHPVRSEVCCSSPADWELSYEEISLMTEDGLELRGWYLSSQNNAAVIVAHGIGGNRTSQLAQGMVLAEAGYGALLIDLRAHGESEGDSTFFGGTDALAAAGYLQKRPEVEAGRIGVYGVSLGGLVGLQAAAESQSIRAVLADGPGPNNFRDLPRPPSLVHALDWPYQWVAFQVWDRKGVSAPDALVEIVGSISPRPILIISGTASQYEEARMSMLFEAAGENADLWEVPEAGHVGAWSARPAEYQDRMLEFFNQALLGDHQ